MFLQALVKRTSVSGIEAGSNEAAPPFSRFDSRTTSASMNLAQKLHTHPQETSDKLVPAAKESNVQQARDAIQRQIEVKT